MTPKQYLAALIAAGVDQGLPIMEIDRQASLLLKINKRTTRRYRRGETKIPGPITVALRALKAVNS